MTPTDDPVVRLLSRLPAVTPDQTRAMRTRERCARALSASVRSRQRRDWHRLRAFARRRDRHRLRAESILVGAFSVIYIAAMFADWLRWRSL